MTYLIDAWLDRPHPYLRILNRDTGEVCAMLEEDALDEPDTPDATDDDDDDEEEE